MESNNPFIPAMLVDPSCDAQDPFLPSHSTLLEPNPPDSDEYSMSGLDYSFPSSGLLPNDRGHLSSSEGTFEQSFCSFDAFEVFQSESNPRDSDSEILQIAEGLELLTPASEMFQSDQSIPKTTEHTSRGRGGLTAGDLNGSGMGRRRELPRHRSRYRTRRSAFGALIYSTPEFGSPNPLERWQYSPPEHEPASPAAIHNALKSQPLGIRDHQTGELHRRQSRTCHSSTSSIRSETSSSSRRSTGSARSVNSNPYSRSQRPLPAKSGPRRRKRNFKPDDRIFKCTFCCDSFKTKYEWSRHEKSLHLSVEAWQCAPYGGTVVSEHTGRVHCSYCSILDPTPEHLDTHNHEACQGSSADSRLFARKDHLVQHLRHFHRLETLPLIDNWKFDGPDVSSRCGFCNKGLATWRQRADHLASHFQQGMTMADWKGDHGFSPSVAARVTNALPPYLLDYESHTLVPFSATNNGVEDHRRQILKQARSEPEGLNMMDQSSSVLDVQVDSHTTGSHQEIGYNEVLTLHLARYAREQMRLGIIPSDEMFQRESRKLFFESEDSWNQTAADNQEWLAAFRKQQGCSCTTPQ